MIFLPFDGGSSLVLVAVLMAITSIGFETSAWLLLTGAGTNSAPDYTSVAVLSS